MAPSPTGFVHLGSARTALFDYLFARRHGGLFVLRVEDTDEARNRPEFEAAIYEGLHWLGLNWDEGPDVGGAHGPYRQSERMDLYREAAAGLLKSGAAYRCWCTKEELDAEREAARAAGRPYKYSRRCLTNPPADRDQRPFTVRFQVPEGEARWDDLVRGEVVFDLDTIGDFIVMRAEGTPLYNFSVAVDDAGMEITHVFRGEEHISNTPAQLLILDALGHARPAYAHLPVIVGQDRQKLSKRKHPETRLALYQELGYLPAAMVNYLALLGWNPGTEQELFSLAELEEVFDLNRVQRSSAMFDWRKLDWLNGHYIRTLARAELAAQLAPFVPDLRPELLPLAAEALQERLRRLADAREILQYLWTAPGPAELEPDAVEKVRAAHAALEPVEWRAPEIEAALNRLLEDRGWSKGALFNVLRLVVTGQKVAPPVHYTLALLPRDEALRRLARVL
ncbi:MAG TPA: glutamate--tRNA ligase [Candidatus Dormibacteraeota bacterium]